MRELLARIDSRELAEWMAAFNLAPWGDERADLRAGIVASTIVNVNGGKSKPSDFLPKYGQQEPKQQTPEDIRNMALRINAMFKGTVR
ncbi:MAG: hypothetical protein QM754_07070 [Tepidisphaeraceae bacterium]